MRPNRSALARVADGLARGWGLAISKRQPSGVVAPGARLDWAFACVVLIGTGGYLLVTLWATWPIDLSAVYYAAKFYALGEPDLVYASHPRFFGAAVDPEWERVAQADGAPERGVVPYLYPPLWVVLLAPIAKAVPPMAFFQGGLVLHITACLAAVPLAWRLIRPDGITLSVFVTLVCAFLLWTYHSLFAFLLNQPQLLVIFLTILAFERQSRGASAAAGIALGLAAGLKIMPILLVVIFAMQRDWRALGFAFGTAGLLAVLSFLLAGPDLHWAMLEQIRRVGDVLLIGSINHGLEAFFVHLADPAGSVPVHQKGFYAVRDAETWAANVARALLIAGTLATWWVTRQTPNAQGFQLLAMTNLIILCGPLGWSHYFVTSLILLPVLFTRLSIVNAVLVVVATAILLGQPLSLIILELPFPNLYLSWIGTAWLLAVYGLTLWTARKGTAESA